MKIAGKKLEGRNVELVPIIRQSGNIVFKIEAIDNYDKFNKLVSLPKPPTILKPGGVQEIDLQNEGFRKAMVEYATMRTNYMIVTGISSTDDLEWESVKLDDPSTWANYRKELVDFGLTDTEIERVIKGVMQANCLDEGMIEQAKKDFLAGVARPKE